MEAKQKQPQKKVKLLEEISTAPKQQAAPAQQQIPAQQKSSKPSIEDLQSLIMDKLNQLESSHAPNESGEKAQNSKAAPGEQPELIQRLEAIYNNSELDNAAKVEKLYTFYLEVVLEELKNAHKSQLSLKLQEELLVYKANTIYDERSKRAQIILNKYEVLTREYQNQNKALKENHERIIASEKAKR